MNKKGVIIQASSRSMGNTNKISLFIQELTNYDIIDLKTKNILPFDYDFKNSDDDFLPLIREIAEKYDYLIFITPVYWYTMSGILKTFFDRISDCLKIEKETGRKLRGKSMSVLSCGSDEDKIEFFDLPFKKSAAYLGMNYLGYIHAWIENNEIPEKVKKELKEYSNNILGKNV